MLLEVEIYAGYFATKHKEVQFQPLYEYIDSWTNFYFLERILLSSFLYQNKCCF